MGQVFSMNLCGVPIVPLLGILLVFHVAFVLSRPYIFAWFMDWFSGVYNERMASFKQELLQDLPTLREKPSIDGKTPSLTILEIGVGTGANFKYYPEGTDVIAVEPNKNFAGYLEKNVAEYAPRVRLQRTVVAFAEDLRGHVDDCSVDAVVCTLVLCSVKDVDAVVREVKRVLKPGGKFYFLEHVAAEPGTWTRTAQWFIHPIWLYVLDHCWLMRTPWVNIGNVGFSDVNYKKYVAPLGSLFAVIRPHVMGVATK